MHPEDFMKQTWESALEAARKTPRCGAKTRNKDHQCQSPAMTNGRCHMRGGKSPGAPRGENHGRYYHGGYTTESRYSAIPNR